MTPSDRIAAFIKLGLTLKNLTSEEKEELTWRAGNTNSWFTAESVQLALDNISEMLSLEKLKTWLDKYDLKVINHPKAVGILMAGNIPAVGFHDLMCVLISGNKAVLKLSKSDEVLMKFLINRLIEIEGRLEALIQIQDMLKNMDAYIATGSDNSARYFNYYFGRYPHVIRQNRISVAVLTGDETASDFLNLGKDVFQYFGLGCRNVSKLYVKSKSQILKMLDAFAAYEYVAQHHKYHNNYDYNKSIYLVNRDEHLDNGFLLVKESSELVSPIAVLYYEIYDSEDSLKNSLKELDSKIQCVVGSKELWPEAIPFGEAQCPGAEDYADRVDTLKFLLEL